MVLTVNSTIVEPEFDTVPEEMRRLNNWVVWKAEPSDKVTKDGEQVLDKVLKQTNGKPASTTSPATWTSFQDAYQSYSNGNFDGIGFVFEPNNRIIGVDMDGHFSDGEPITKNAEVMCSKTYVEVSPSGTGGHAYFIGDLPDDIKHKHKDSQGEIEIYNSGRYFTFTGQMVGQDEILEDEKFINIIIKQFFHKETPDFNIDISDERSRLLPSTDIKRKMLKNEKINRLFDGDIADYEDDDSSADMALANYLAFYTAKNYKQMDEIFRESGLMRDKWDEMRGDVTYGERTLKKAILECRNVYKHSTINPQEAGSYVWDDLVTFDHDAILPFPRHIFPDWLEEYIDQVSQSTQTPRDMAAMGAFTALSIASNKKFNINIFGDWSEPLNTYLLTLMPPSSKKSQVFNHMMNPISDFQKEFRDFMKPKIRENKDNLEIKEKRIASLKKRIIEPKKGDTVSELEEDLSYAREDLENTNILTEPTYIVDDVTPEVLAQLLEENDEKIGIVSAEGGLFTNIQGRYSDVTNYDVYLSGHPGDRMSTHRLSREAVELEEPLISIGIFAQPSIIQSVPRELFDKGLMARFLYSLPNDNRGERQIRPRQIDPQVKDKYYNNVRGLMGLNANNISLTMSDTADSKVQLLQEEIELRQGVGEDLRENEDIESWSGKIVGQLMRLAGLIHMSKTLTTSNYVVQPETIDAADRLKEYFISHMKKAFNISNADQSTADAEYLIGKILEMQEDGLVKRQKLWQSVKRKFKNASHLDKTLKLLEDRSYIKVSYQKISEDTHKKTKFILINPIAL